MTPPGFSDPMLHFNEVLGGGGGGRGREGGGRREGGGGRGGGRENTGCDRHGWVYWRVRCGVKDSVLGGVWAECGLTDGGRVKGVGEGARMAAAGLGKGALGGGRGGGPNRQSCPAGVGVVEGDPQCRAAWPLALFRRKASRVGWEQCGVLSYPACRIKGRPHTQWGPSQHA